MATPCTAPSWILVPCLQSHLVVSVACGGGFCTALTARGELWAWGETATGALGTCSNDAVSGAQPVQSAPQPSLVCGELSGRRVAVVACGDSHAVAATFDE